MSRLRAFTYGAGGGVLAYLTMDVFLTTHLSRLDAGLQGLRREVNPSAPSAGDARTGAGGVLQSYRDQAADSLRANWNAGIHSAYNGFVAAVRNPNLFGMAKGRESAEPALEQPTLGGPDSDAAALATAAADDPSAIAFEGDAPVALATNNMLAEST